MKRKLTCGLEVILLSRDIQFENYKELVKHNEVFNTYKYSAELTDQHRCGYAIHVNDRSLCFDQNLLEPIYTRCVWRDMYESNDSTTFEEVGRDHKLANCKYVCDGYDKDCAGHRPLEDIL